MKRLEADLYTHIGGCSENEDSAEIIRVSEHCLNAVVADGLGGQGDGTAASGLVCRELRALGRTETPMTREELDAGIRKANEALVHAQKNSTHMKTTVVYLRLEEDTALWAHIGDSRLYHFWNGELAEYTLDHSLSQVAVFLGQITREQIPGHSGRSLLIHAMGTPGEEPDISERIPLLPGRHAFLLCSDGYWEYLTDAEIMQTLHGSETAAQWNRAMQALVCARCPEDADNRTAVTIFADI